jgi:hypothetical protein
MHQESGIYIRLIKGFKFPEPVFFPKSLKRDFRFLGDPIEIRKRVQKMGKSKYPWEPIDDFGNLKPIRNPWVKFDRFWVPFQYTLPHNAKDLGFRFYPFQVVPNLPALSKANVNEALLRKLFNINFQSIHTQNQIRLYPSGIGTIHFIIHLQSTKNIDAIRILDILFNTNWLHLPFLLRENAEDNFNQWSKYLCGKFLRQISEYKEPDREIRRGISIINLQGNFQTSTMRQALEKFASTKQRPLTFLETGREEIISLYNNLLFLYIDQPISKLRIQKGLKRPYFIFHGRRCFRGHHVNIIELAYCSAYLLKFYRKVAKGIFGFPEGGEWVYTLEKILSIPDYIDDKHLKKTYAYELYSQGVDENFVNDLKDSVEKSKFLPTKGISIDTVLSKLLVLGKLIIDTVTIFA